MIYSAPFKGRRLAATTAVIAASITESATAYEQQDNPDTAVATTAVAASVVTESTAAYKEQDNPQATIVAKTTSTVSSASFTATSTVCST